jgi:hypothetical protein
MSEKRKRKLRWAVIGQQGSTDQRPRSGRDGKGHHGRSAGGRIHAVIIALAMVASSGLVTSSIGIATAKPAAALGQPPGPGDYPAASGSWGALENWPLIAIHSALDAEGRVLTYGTNGDGQQTGQFIYDVWTPGPSAAGGHATLPNTTQTDLFCSLQINRPDTGEMLLFGGDNWTGAVTNNLGNPDITSYDPVTQQLTSLPGMHRPRWYATGTTRPDGSIYVQGGDGGWDRPELWTADGGSQLLDLDTSGLSWWYPRNFVLPDGRIFGVDVEGRMYYISPDLSSLTMAGRLTPDRWGFGATAVMYEPGKILHFGGTSASAVIIDANGAAPVVTQAANLSVAREWGNATLLPDGRVLATGGASNYSGAAPGATLAEFGVAYSAEIWDPASGQWTIQPAEAAARLYHSTALLLPDGRVLVAGGGAPGPVANTNAEIFTPNYLTAQGGGATNRPTIDAVSTTELKPGDGVGIDVTSNVDIGRVTMVKTGSVTHSFNMDQRIANLPFSVTGNTVNAVLPNSNNEITPGYYLLTVLTTTGVPSESVMIHLGTAPVPAAPGAPTDAQITRLYLAYFQRLPEESGLAYWRSVANSGVGLAAISDVFAASAEFIDTYGALDDGQFVDQVYTNVLGRAPDAGGLGYWTGQLAAGVTRGQVMLSFSESAEFIDVTNTGGPQGPPPPQPPPGNAPAYRNEVYRLYRAYLLREPEAEGLDYWAGQRAAGISLIAVSDVFAGSEEFVGTYGALDDGQFVDQVYTNVLERPADDEGRAYWIGQLAAGVSRGELMVGFSESPEFVAKVGPFE